MKTRRILAASTAALLAFGTTAIVAFAGTNDNQVVTVEYKNVTLSLSGLTVDADTTAASFTTSNVVAKGTIVTTTTGSDDPADDGVVTQNDQTLATSTYTVSAEGSNKTSWTVKATFAGKGANGADLVVSKTFAIAFNGAAADITAGAGTDLELNTNVKAQIGKDSSTKKEFKGYEIKASNVTIVADDDMVNVDDSPVIKDLKSDLKAEFEDIKADDVAIVNIDLSKDGIVKTSAPGNVTIKVKTAFKPSYVYHVVDDSAELIKMTGTPDKLADGTGYITTFTTKSFSPFILTTTKLKNTGVAAADVDSEAVDTSNTSNSTTNPDTGIALAIAPVVLAAGAVAVVALKKKH